jgi:hypothetical protein
MHSFIESKQAGAGHTYAAIVIVPCLYPDTLDSQRSPVAMRFGGPYSIS